MKNEQRNTRPTIGARDKILTIIALVLVIALVFVLGINLSQRIKSQGAYRNEYEGRVMDKWVGYHESQQGTRISRHLLIKSKNNEVFQVSVSPELYEQAKVGNWLLKDKEGLRILEAEP